METADLQALAVVYGATEAQLLAPPEEAHRVAMIERIREISGNMDETTLEQWLSLGTKLAKS